MIFGQDIKSSISSSISRCVNNCYIATAYCKKVAFEDLLIKQSLNSKVKILILRWQLNDLLSGASDLDVYTLAKNHGWQIFINPRLHAKVYRFDDEFYIGSANLTRSGLTGDVTNMNLETVVKQTVDDVTKTWFSQLIKVSRKLDDELFRHIKQDVESFSEEYNVPTSIQYSATTINLLSTLSIDKLYTHDFFWLETPGLHQTDELDLLRSAEHDLSLLRLATPVTQHEMSTAFHESKAFQWLLTILIDKKEIYFGELTTLLHDTLQDDPGPYRKSVKILLNNLINWVGIYSQTLMIIDQPNRSTRIRLIE